MKRMKKFLVGFLAALSVFASSLGLTACSLGKGSSNKGKEMEIKKVYAQYVVYAEAEGQTPLSYEEWLLAIKGEKGVGIEKVEFDENGDLLITLTDGTKQTVEMPQQEEHVHTFDEWTAFTVDGTPCESRLFFRVCTDCNVVEWRQGESSEGMSSEGMIMPLETAALIHDFGFYHNQTLNCYYEHTGLDFSAEVGTEVMAVAAGKIESIYKDDLLLGTEIIIDHGDGLKSVYRFVNEIEGLSVGDRVRRGEVIATIAEANGNEYKDGPHLHFEIIENGKIVDPVTYLRLEEK